MAGAAERIAPFQSLDRTERVALPFRPLAETLAAPLGFEALVRAPAGAETSAPAPAEDADPFEEARRRLAATRPAEGAPPMPDVATLSERLAEREAEIAALTAAHEADMARLRQEMETDVARTLEDGLKLAGTRTADSLAGTVEAVLHPFLDATLRRHMLTQFRDAVREAVDESGAIAIRVSGPPSLLDALKAMMPGDMRPVDYVVADAVELTAEIDNRLIATRLSHWAGLLDGGRR